MIRGFEFKGLDLKNADSKMQSIGLDMELISRREDALIYLINYLGVVTREQLCLTCNVLDESIRTSFHRITKLYGDVINVKRDEDYKAYYSTNRRAITVLKGFSDTENNMKFNNKKHLSKINDFFISLFISDCNKLKIEYECNIKYLDKVLRADAIINAEQNGLEYEIILEQDNNTIKETKLLEKVNSYYNMLLHSPLYNENKVHYYIFRLDIFMTKAQIKISEKLLNKDNIYIEYCKGIKELEDLYYAVKNGEIDWSAYGYKAEQLGVRLADKKTVFLNNISSLKTAYKMEIEALRRHYRIEVSSKYLKKRIENVKNTLQDEFEVQYFDSDSNDDTIFSEITGNTRFSCVYSKIEGRSILLRTNFICGDRNVDLILNKYIFGEINIVIKIIEDIYDNVRFDLPNVNPFQQLYMKIGYELVLFSNVVKVKMGDSDVEDFIMLMPTISVSDKARIDYLISLDSDVIDCALSDKTVFLVVVPDLESKLEYTKITKNFNSNKSSMMVVVVEPDSKS